MKIRDSILSCITLLLAAMSPAGAATPSAPAYLDVSIQQGSSWKDGLTVNFLPDEKLCRSKYGNKQWQSACATVLGEDGEPVRGITISPAVPGTWRWAGRTSARFTPRETLSPSASYTIDTAGMHIPASVKLSRPQAKITTRPLAVSMPQHNVWVDPSERGAHMLTARMTFTYPVKAPSQNLFIVKKTAGSEGLKLGNLKQIWNAEKDSVMLSVPLLSLPEDKGGVSFNVTGYRPYTLKDGSIVFQTGKDAAKDASWIVPVQSSPFVVKGTSFYAVSSENLDKTWELQVNLSMHVRSDDLAKALTVGELPLYNTPGADRPYDWDKAGRIPVDLMANATPLRLVPMQPDDFASSTLRYRVSPRQGYSIFVKLPQSLTSTAGKPLARSWLSIHKAYEFSSELNLLQPGSILPLRGDRKIDIHATGLDSIRWNATRVRKPFLAMLGALDGTFANPLEDSPVNFDLLGEPAGKGTLALPPSPSGKAQFAALDLSPVLSFAGDASSPKGMIQLNLEGIRKGEETCSVSRFILVTDLGLIVKRTLTGALDVFTCSLSGGKPASGIKVSILSRNGLPCVEAKTDSDGKASLPSLAGMPAEKAPVAVVAESPDGDLAWLPLNDHSRRADYSAFAVNGRSASSEGLNAHVFSQRGIYRPGEKLHFGCILRRTDWNPIPAGIPLLAVLSDPSGKELFRRSFTSTPHGLAEFDWSSEEASRTGRYTLDIRIPGRNGSIIGSSSVLLKDFTPETMRMKATVSPAASKGWLYTGEGLAPEIHATLTDLYGAAAANRRVTARLVTEPASLSHFAEWPGFTFCDPSEGIQFNEKDLPEARTSDDGTTVIQIPAGIATTSSAACRVELRGFEPDGGRSVSASAGAVLSPRRFLVGYRPDGSVPKTDFIPQGRNAGMKIIAVDSDLKPVQIENLTFTVAERRFVSNLVSDSRGAFRYAETPVDKEISKSAASISSNGLDWRIPTELPGEFILKITDASGATLAAAPFTIVGERLRGTAETTDAGIRLHLAKEEYNAGDTIDMSMTVPYDGAGLITIERDGVYAHRWFNAKAGDTVQSIKIPSEFEGKGYVNVTFARAAGSQDIYLTPFACAAAPFTAGTARRDLGLKLDVPTKARPGEPLKVRISSSSAGKALVFAVDEGILQLTRFTLPDPLRHLLKDRALDVTTLQAFDLVMPDHGIMKSRIPGFGGGDALAAAAVAGMQNPFKRRSEPPVAWWSGIIDVSQNGTELTVPLPDWCGTTLRFMAVGCSPTQAGSTSSRSIIRDNIVITPQMPLAVAPGDSFEAAVAISAPENTSEAFTVSMNADEALSIEGPASFEIPAGTTKETVHIFRVRVNENPGDAGITFKAVSTSGRSIERRGSLSVRPASSLASGLTAGKASGPLAVAMPRNLIPYDAQATLSVSPLPVPAVRGLVSFLDGWSYGCTEQVISKAFPYALLRRTPDILAGPSRPASKVIKDADKKIEEALAAISERRSGDERVSWWPGGQGSDFLTIYAADFLMTLREEGIGVPGGLLESICDAVERFAGTTVTDNEDARLKAYAIWVLSREGRVMTHELENLDRYRNDNGGMSGDIAPLFIAASREILHMNWQFNNLDPAKISEGSQFDVLSAQAFRSILTSRYFPNAKGDHAGDLVNAAMTAVNNHGYSTFSAAQAIRAVLTVRSDSSQALASVQLNCIAGQKASVHGDPSLPLVSLDAPLCRRFTVDAPAGADLYWMLSTRGYDRNPSVEPESTGMEITRTYLNASGAPVTSVRQGEEVTVQIKARTYGNISKDCVIADLLPGGFEQSENLVNGNDEVMFTDKREDRTLIFATIGSSFTYTYKIRAVNRGTFIVPSSSCEAMYDRTRRARTASGTITVQ